MKALLVMFTCLIQLLSFASDDSDMLIIRTSIKSEKKFKIKKIRKDRLSVDGPRVIVVETYGKEKCVIPMDKIVNQPRAKYEGCSHCIIDDNEYENFYTQLFLNRSKAEISCDIHNGEVIGFNFLGSTTINGKSMLTSKGMIFDSAAYSEGPFLKEPKEKNAVEKVLDGVGDVLLKLAF